MLSMAAEAGARTDGGVGMMMIISDFDDVCYLRARAQMAAPG